MHLLTVQAEPVRGHCACGCFMSTNPLHEVESNSLPCKCGPDLVTPLLQIECGRNDHMSLPGLGREKHFSFCLPVPGSVWLCLSLCLFHVALWESQRPPEEVPVARNGAPCQQPSESASWKRALRPQSHSQLTTAPAAILTTASRDAPQQSSLATHHQFLTHRTAWETL